MIPPLPAARPGHLPPTRTDLHAQARALETAFIAEMLKAAGTARVDSGLSDASADSAFDIFWAEAQARALMAAGGLGLTESLLAGLERRAPGAAQ